MFFILFGLNNNVFALNSKNSNVSIKNSFSANDFFNPKDTIDTQLYVVTKNDGAEYIGIILSNDAREVLLKTDKLGEIYIAKSDIKSIVKIEDTKSIVNGEFYSSGPFTTRYAFTTNALPMKKDENYMMLNLYGPEVHFTVSDHFNLGIMSTWVGSPLVLAAKYTIKTKDEKVNLSLGTLFGSSGYINSFKGFGGLHFANITFGDTKGNITFAAGYGYLQSGNESYNNLAPGIYYTDEPYFPYDYTGTGEKAPAKKGIIFSVAGITKIGKKASFVFDSMIGSFKFGDNTESMLEITPVVYLPEYIPGKYKHTITYVENRVTALFLMPGIRIQTSETRAFQVSLAGVVVSYKDRNYNSNGSTSNESHSFPLPMASWFFTF